MKKKLIQFKNIVKSYEDGKVVLKGIDLDIYENEFVDVYKRQVLCIAIGCHCLQHFLERDVA